MTDDDGVAVNEQTAIVDADVVAYMYIVAKADDDAIAYRDVGSYTAEQFTYHAISAAAVGIGKRVVLLHPFGSPGLALDKDGTVAIVYLASHTFVLFGLLVGSITAFAFICYDV